MDLLQQNMQIEESPQTTLLYFDTISSQKSQYNVEEIFFNKAVRLQQIRLLKTDSNPHPQIKSMKSETQKSPIYNFEVFARNLKKISDKFECVVGCCTANKDSGESDSIFPVYSELVTNHIVLRGTYEKITLCIYGIPFEGQENNILLENGRNEVPLEKLQEDEEGIRPFERPEEKFTLTPQDQNILSNWSIDKLLQDYLKFNYSNSNFIKGCYYINKPNIEMIEITKGGYIYYENELFQCGKALLNDYLRFIQNPSLILTESEIIGHQSRFKQIYEIIKNFLGKNKAYLEEDCCFRKENLQILSNQNDLIQIIIYSLNGSLYGDTEIKYGLKLLKLISNSENLSKHFIELNGMEMLYGILLRSEQTETAYPIKQYLPYLKFSNQNKSDSNKNLILIILCLECIYKLISYKDICNRFLDILDKKKISSVSYYLKEHSKENKEANIPTDFVIINNFSMPNTLGSSQEKKEDKKEKEKEKDKDKERDKKEKEKDKEKDRDKKDKDKEKDKEREKDKEKEKSKKDKDKEKSTKDKEKKDKDKDKDTKDKDRDKDKKDKDKERDKDRDKDKERDKEKDKDRDKDKKEKDKEKDRDKDKDKDRKHKKHHSSKRSHSRSRSRSKSSRDKHRKSKEKEGKSDTHNLKDLGKEKGKEKEVDSKGKKKLKTTSLKNGYQIVSTLLVSKKNYIIANIIKHIIKKVNLMLFLKNLNSEISLLMSPNSQRIINYDFITQNLRQIFSLIQSMEVPYNKSESYPNDTKSLLDSDYPYRYSWSMYSSSERFFYQKSEENLNIPSLIRKEVNALTLLKKAGIISNEIALILEENYFFENLLLLLSHIGAQCSTQYYELGLIIKEMLSYFALSKGGINFFCKNSEITANLINFIETINTNEDMSNNSKKFSEYNFFCVHLMNVGGHKEILTQKSEYELMKYSKLNEILIEIPKEVNYSEDIIIKINFLQLKYLLENLFMMIGCLDEISSFKEENAEEVVDKSLELLILLNQNIRKSNLSQQAFLSLIQNEYFFEEVFSFISFISNTKENILQYEGHISLLIQIFIFILSKCDSSSDLSLLYFGNKILYEFTNLQEILKKSFEQIEMEPVNHSIFSEFDILFEILKECKFFDNNQNNSKEFKNLIKDVNKECYSNLKKYNLREPYIKSSNSETEEYFSEYKLTLPNIENNDTLFLETTSNKGNLMNKILSNLKIIYLSVRIFLFNFLLGEY